MRGRSGIIRPVASLFASWVLWATVSASASEISSPVVVVIPAGSETASIAAGHLRQELDATFWIEALAGSEPQSLLDSARARWPDSLIVLLHPDRNETWMWRRRESEPVHRRLHSPPESSAYPVAIAAAELVRNATAEPPPAAGSEFEFAFSLGLGLSGSPGFETAMAQPVFGFDLRLGRDDLWSTAGLRVRGPSSSSTDLGADTSVDYSRTDVALVLGFGPRLAHWNLSVLLEAGLSVVSVHAQRGAEALGSSSRLPFWMGVGTEIRHPVISDLGVVVCVELIRVFSPADFTGSGDVLFSEGDWRLQGQAALEWVL